jgi:hypothetical protein
MKKGFPLSGYYFLARSKIENEEEYHERKAKLNNR